MTPESDILPNALSRLFHPTHFSLKCGAIIVSQRNKNASQGICTQGIRQPCRHISLILPATGTCAAWRRVCLARKQKAPAPEGRIKAPRALPHFHRALLQTAGARGLGWGPSSPIGAVALLICSVSQAPPRTQQTRPQLCYLPRPGPPSPDHPSLSILRETRWQPSTTGWLSRDRSPHSGSQGAITYQALEGENQFWPNYGLPWWSRGYDSTLPMQGTQVGSLVSKLDPMCSS